MAIPDNKHPAIWEQLSKVNSAMRLDHKLISVEMAIQRDECARCDAPATKFRDPVSTKEFTMTGYCQECQDSLYKAVSEMEESFDECPVELRNKVYLGDSVYAAEVVSDGSVILETRNGLPSDPSNTIILEPEVQDALTNFMIWLKTRNNENRKEPK